ncbi:hypothetical protein Nepgr_017923 [Nepenthes gracilis]|uniref:Uncharacterized protein n=1 Tax=Nepenthes gracilis TaxID=150966 RepID=A0AAD3ST59_NEPGR|nr:hypothetical protein Nepgr_017923 [Nepenthes gracilis]
MVSEAKSNGSSSSAAGGLRAKIDHILYSGDKKYVFSGLAIISILFGVPWYLMTRGTKQQSHEDYMERARTERLSSSSSAKS